MHLFWMSCANIIPPTGGPKDFKAPILLKQSIQDSTLNFKGGKLILTFDEFVKLVNVQNEFQSTPFLKHNPTITTHKNKLSINLPDSLLEKNTTYVITFGNAVKDLHEGNLFANYKFTFSTGSYFDSLQLKGTIIDAENGNADTAAFAVLYDASKNDSIIKYEKPLYVFKAQNGVFNFTNLPNKKFMLYALRDKNNNFKYDNAQEAIGFYEGIIEPKVFDSNSYKIYTFIENDVIDTFKNKKNIGRFGNKTKSVDSFRYTILIDTSLQNRAFDITDSLRIQFSKKADSIDINKIKLFSEGILDATSQFFLDTLLNTLKITCEWEQNKIYKIVLENNFVLLENKEKIKGDTIQFRTKQKNDYGDMLLLFNKKDIGNQLMLYKNNVLKTSFEIKDTLMQISFLLPDNYQLKILDDKNKNGRWDTGNFDQRILPEIINIYPETILIRANWEQKINLQEKNSGDTKNKKTRLNSR